MPLTSAGTPATAVLLPGPAAAPAPTDLPDVAQPAPTSRVLLLLSYALVLLLLGLRVPQTYAYLQQHVPATLSAEIHDEGLESLALKTGVFLAYVVTALAVAIFFALARMLEKRVFTSVLPLPGGTSVGLYCLVVVLAVLPVQAAALSGDGTTERGALTYVYVLGVGLLAPLLYRQAWQDEERARRCVIVLTSFGLAALTVIG